MKIPALLITMLALFGACKRHSQPPAASPPQLKVTFGYMDVLFFEPFWNQDSAGRDSMAMLQYVGFELEEENLSKSVYDISNNNLALIFDLYTSGDKEHFDTKQNAKFYINEKSGSNNLANFSASGFVPMRVSMHPSPYNDTLEFSPLGDCIKIDYASQYGDARTRDSLFIIP